MYEGDNMSVLADLHVVLIVFLLSSFATDLKALRLWTVSKHTYPFVYEHSEKGSIIIYSHIAANILNVQLQSNSNMHQQEGGITVWFSEKSTVGEIFELTLESDKNEIHM